MLTLDLINTLALGGVVLDVGTVALSLFLVLALMGRGYDAAVMSGGLCGFMLGTTANGMANIARSSIGTAGLRARSSSCRWSAPSSSTSPMPSSSPCV